VSLDDEIVQEEKPIKLVIIDEQASDFDLEFETPAPYTIEDESITDTKYEKEVVVAHDSSLHYTDVKTCSDLPEEYVELGVEFTLDWIIDGVDVDVTFDPAFAVEYVDTDGNDIDDQMCWIVPQLSEQTFQITAELSVINVQSFPIVGENWEVRFTTLGTSDLTITAVDGTDWSLDNEQTDLNFLEIQCGEQIITSQWVDGSVFIPDYSCDDISFETSKVLTTGEHNLQFTFGISTDHAHNHAREPSEFTFETRISQSTDDAEENDYGRMDLDSDDLDFTEQKVAVRFQNIDIPQGSIITNAYIQFTAEDNHEHQSTGVDIFAEAIDDAPTFSSIHENISDRTKTSASIDWFIPRWHEGESGSKQRTPDISPLIQEVVDRYGWSDGNSMAFIMLKNNFGDRDARTFDLDPYGAPALHIDYFNATLIGTTTANENGDWSVEVSPLSEGKHSIFATTIDGENNESNPSRPILYEVESQANLPPIAVDDFATTLEDIPVSIDVLLNDTDSDGTLVPSTVQVTFGPTNGTITNINLTTGAITYSSDTNFNGFDIFNYTVEDNDGAVSNEAVVTITVDPVNDPPVATDDFYQTDEDISLIVDVTNGVLANDTDVEMDPLTAVLVSTPPNSASFTLDPAGNFTYTPNQDFYGNDSFTYNATDGIANSNVATVTIEVTFVNDNPIIDPITPFTVTVGNNATFTLNNEIFSLLQFSSVIWVFLFLPWLCLLCLLF